jgi:MFS transporter, DHA1 family, inner membrane transport protein
MVERNPAMSTQQTASTADRIEPLTTLRSGLVLAALFLGTFVLGTAELIVVGLLDLIAADLGVSASAAGALVTANALGLAVGGPILAAVTIRLNRRTVLLGALVVFIALNAVMVLVADYGLFIVARVLVGVVQGVFIAAGFAAGISVVEPERMGRAMSAVISGVAVSAAVGVPLGTLLGQALGWRGSFTAIIAVAVVALAAIVGLVPSVPSTGGGVANQARYALAPRVLAVLSLCFLVFAALFAVLTYIVPFLQSVTGISGVAISMFLLAYGAATAIGSAVGGRFADANAAGTLLVGTVGVAVSLAALYLIGTIAFGVALALLALGLFGMGMMPSLQYCVVSLAGPGGQLAQSLPASAVNLGIAFGSAAGGIALGMSTATATVVIGLGIAVVSVVVAWATSFLKPPQIEQTRQPVMVQPTPEPA